MKYILEMIFFILIFSLSLLEGQLLLKQGDIHKVMEDIFQQHVNKKEVSLSIFRQATKNFIEQADPDHVYLLDSEVPTLSDQELEALILRYKKGDYSTFVSMNETIQKAFLRARKWRLEHKGDYSRWMDEAKESLYKDSWEDWAKTPKELEGRWESYFKSFVEQWIHHFGKGREKELLQKFEEELSDKEDLYLYRSHEGEPLSGAEKENLLSLHILKALAAALDSHTKIYDPTEALDMRIRLEKGYKGVGIILEKGNEGLRVAEVLPNSPAAKSQLIFVGDELLEVNGENLRNLDLQEALNLIREAPDEKVTLTLLREGKKLIRIELNKSHILLDIGRVKVSQQTFGNGIIGVIKLDTFYQGNGVSSEKDVKEAIDKLDDQNLRGLILDLRDNSGGFLTQAVKVAGLFITNGVVVISKYSSGEEKIYRDLDGKADYKGPLVILVSRMTASAAEIVAEALQDYGVALIVGDDHTYGKGTIQSQTVTDEKSASSYFKVTVGKYYTVSGKTPQLRGVLSDIVVPGPLSHLEIGEEYLGGAISQDTIPATYADKLEDVDPKLKKWYLQYYSPSLQPREKEWQRLLPELRKKSAERLSHNQAYQNFLREKKEAFEPNHDLQLEEAYNIVKDIIYLDHKKELK